MKYSLLSLAGRWRNAGVLLIALAAPLQAHEGHDHGAPVPVVAGQPVQPHFAVASEDFEVVGVLADDGVTLYLDDAASNRPLAGATLEVTDGAAVSGVAASVAAGTYRLPLKASLPAGKHALTLTVVAGERSDLLSATLEVGSTPVVSPGAVSSESTFSRGKLLAIGAGVLLLAGLAGAFYFRRQLRRPGAAGK